MGDNFQLHVTLAYHLIIFSFYLEVYDGECLWGKWWHVTPKITQPLCLLTISLAP